MKTSPLFSALILSLILSFFPGATLLAADDVAPKATQSAANNDIVKVASKHSVKETMDRFENIVTKKGFTIFARIDHHEGAKKIGMDMNDAQVLIFGNPKVGTLIMKLDPSAGLDLPLRVLVYADNNGKTWLSYHNPQTLKQSYQVENSPVIDKVEKGMEKLTAKAAE